MPALLSTLGDNGTAADELPKLAKDSGAAWKGGYCTQWCGIAAGCPDAASSVTYADGTVYCATSCGSDTDCRDGYVCAPSVNACLPDCRQGWSCGSSLACNTDTCWCG